MIPFAGENAGAPTAARAGVRSANPPGLPAAMPRRLGDYELLDEIARGGMGVICRARQISLNRIVALKMIRDGALASPKTLARFRLEAEAVAKLHHPNIVPIHDFGEVDGHWFLSLSLIEGRDLARELHGVPMTSRPLAALMIKLARAVHYAHQRGVLHRDLKPANILLDAAGDPHVTDFGLAKLIDADGVVAHSVDIVGSPNYMAPEQAVGGSEQVTTAADVYSLGAIMYELLSGRPPFKAATPLETLRKVMEEDPVPPRQLYSFADAELETICLKCMEKLPRQRYDSAAALAEDLGRWLGNRTIQARPASTVERVMKWGRRNPRVAVLIALVNVVGFVGLAGILGMSARATASARESHERLVRLHVATGNRLVEENDHFEGLLWLTEALRLERGPAPRTENHRYRLEAVSQRSPRLEGLLFHSEWIIAVAMSPDGSRVLTGGADGTARVWDAQTGAALLPPLPHSGQVEAGQFSADGQRLLTMDAAGMARVWAAASGTALTPPMKPADFDRNAIERGARKLSASARFSPDDARVLTAHGSRSAHVWDATSGAHLLALTHEAVVHHAAFSADGRYVVTSSSDKTARIWEAQTGRPAAAPLAHDRFVAWAQFSPDGRTVLTVSGREEVHLWDWAAGRLKTPALVHGGVVFQASFSPDGTRVLTAGWDMTARIWDAATGLGIARLYHPGGLEGAAFSPDGRWIATACYDGKARLWPVEGSERPAKTLPVGAPVEGVVFSPDGRRLAVASWNGTLHLWKLFTDDPLVRSIPQPEVIRAEFDADANRVLAASAGESRIARVWDQATGAAIGPALTHAGPIRRASFSRDSQRALTASDDGTARLWDIATGRELIPHLPHPSAVLDAIFSRDQHTIVTACDDGRARLWDAATGRLTGTLTHDGAVTSLAVSPDGVLVATGSADGTARLWTLATAKPRGPSLTNLHGVRQVQFSGDGVLLLTACDSPGRAGGAAQVWEIGSGRALGTPMRHDDDVVAAEFSANGRVVVTASSDRSARVWDALTGRPITPPLWHRNSVVHAVLTPDANRVATLTTDGEARLWDATTGEPITPSLPHPNRYDAGRLMFSPDGQRLLIATGADAVFLHEFTKTTAALGDLLLEAQVLSAHRIDPTAGMVALGNAALSNAWHTLHPRPPAPRAR